MNRYCIICNIRKGMKPTMVNNSVVFFTELIFDNRLVVHEFESL